MILRTVLLAVLVAGCAAPPTASPVPVPRPGTRAFAGAGLKTYAVGKLSGEIALVIRPVTPKPLDTTTSYRELWAVPLDGRPPVLAVIFRTPEVGSTIETNSLAAIVNEMPATAGTSV